MYDAHVGDDAELYAMGMLSPEERRAVDAHLAQCSTCLRRVGQAEETMLVLDRQYREVRRARPPLSRWWVPAAVAAAFIAGILFADTFLGRHNAETDSPTLALIHSHFNHAQFAGSGPAAKVLYARDRSWLYVIVEGAHRYNVYAGGEGTMRKIGMVEPHGSTSELFARPPAGEQRVELRDGAAALEAAQVR
jgi:hypothetical protein